MQGIAEMDCLAYRRIKLATPQDASPEIILHASECRECAAFTRQLEAFEQELHSTLHIPVPEGLAEKIILRRGRPHWLKASWLPVAAAIVVTLATLVALNTLPSRDSFSQQFVDHVLSEPDVVTANADVEADALKLAFADFGGKLQTDIGDVRYIGQCRIGGVTSTHVQISTRSGDAALLLRPGRSAEIDIPEVHEGHAVVVVPVPRGSLAIVAATSQQATQIRSLVLASSNFHG